MSRGNAARKVDGMTRLLNRTDYGLIRSVATAITSLADYGQCESDRMTANESIQLQTEIERLGMHVAKASQGVTKY